MKKSINNMKRRDFIRNSAAGMASASMVNAFTQRALARETDFKRVIFWFVPEGAAQQAFWPASEGKLIINQNASLGTPQSNGSSIRGYRNTNTAGYCLQPLKAHENDISLYSGFTNVAGNDTQNGDPHARVMNNAMTGGRASGGSINAVLGRQLKGPNNIVDDIFMGVYGGHAHPQGTGSYLSPHHDIGGATRGVGWNPVTGYKSLFPNGVPEPDAGGGTAEYDHTLNARLEILKDATARLDQVKCEGGDLARSKMEAYLQSFETLEAQTQRAIDADASSGTVSDVTFDIPANWVSNTGGNYYKQSDNFGALVKIAIDTTIAALATDRTRVSLMQFSATGNNLGKDYQHDHYKKVGIQGIEGNTQDHHLGHDNTGVRRRDQARIFRWYYSQLAYLIKRLKEIPDGTGSLFDCTLIVTCSEFGMYNHRQNDIPYILAGSLGGTLKTGQYVDVHQGQGFKHQSALFLGIAQALGANINSFGLANTPYRGIMS